MRESTFIQDMDMVYPEGRPKPGVSSFILKDDKIYHLNKTHFGPGDNF